MSVRLRSIDFLRGLAALAVSFGHAVVVAPYESIGGSAFTVFCHFTKWLSATGVPLFFVISGFCIHLSSARKAASKGAARFEFVSFWRRRLWRLYPTYFVVLCASMGLVVMFFLTGSGEEIVRSYPEPRARWIAWDFAAHATMLHGLHPFFDQAGGNPPFWTLAREEYLYLLYPVILLLRSRVRWSILAILMAALTIVIELIAQRTADAGWRMILVTSAPALWIQWYLGSVAADAYCGTVRLPRVFAMVWLVPFWIALAYIAPFATIWIGLAYFTLVNACVARESSGGWADSGGLGLVGWLGALGLYSYSLYLVNDPVHNVLLAASRRLGDATSVTPFMLRALLFTIASVVVARVLFLAVERRFLGGASFLAQGRGRIK